MRKLTYFIATSLDGYIAAPDGDGDYFNQYLDPEFIEYLTTEWAETIPTHGHAMLGLDTFEAKHFDAVLMGRGTYDVGQKLGVTSPYAHLRQYVATRSLTTSPDPAVELISRDVLERVRELKAQDGLGIWLCGGSDLVGALVDEIDEFVVKTYPVLAGAGLPMARAGFEPRALRLIDVKGFGGGQVVTRYARKR
ncbi:dihydrofolate reductase family protein [Streptomyces sp. NPDC003038]|uniref:dihydrofolate reductase family protein n=1 Tax=unclassified Streptomyces TaxID=2593676 RepID=UPI0033B321BC